MTNHQTKADPFHPEAFAGLDGAQLTEQAAGPALAAAAHWLQQAADAYYIWDSPVADDALYDAVFRTYRMLEAAWPKAKPANSPSDRIGGAPREGFVKTTHRARLYSMEDVFTDAEVGQFDARMRRELEAGQSGWWVDPKREGLACNLV